MADARQAAVALSGSIGSAEVGRAGHGFSRTPRLLLGSAAIARMERRFEKKGGEVAQGATFPIGSLLQILKGGEGKGDGHPTR